MFLNIINSLNSDEIIQDIGFFCGFMWKVLKISENENPIIILLNFPLSTIFNSIGYAYLIKNASQFITEQLPRNFRFIVPISMCFSVLYLGYNQVKLLE
jgi:hypothetical protein